MSADWKFASHEGYLSWTLPALPSGGQRLYSKLTPTLLLGQLQADDAIPVDYIDIPSIREVFMKSAISIQCDRHSGESVLLVADTADQARDWLNSLRQAMRNSEHYTASAVQTSPIAVNAPRMSWEASTSQTPYSTLTSALREEKLRQEGTRQGANPYSTQPNLQQSTAGANNTNNVVNAASQSSQAASNTYTGAFSSSTNAPMYPNRSGGDLAGAERTYWDRGSTVGANGDGGHPPPPSSSNMFNSPTWRPAPSQSAAYNNPNEYQQQQAHQQQPAFQSMAASSSRPLPDQQDNSRDMVRPVSLAAGLETPRPFVSSVALDNMGSRPLPQQNPPIAAHPTDLRYARSGDVGVAQSVTVASNEERPVAGLSRPLALQVPAPNGPIAGSASLRLGGFHTQPTPEPAWGDLGTTSGSRPLSPEHQSRPLDPNGQLRYTSLGLGSSTTGGTSSSMGAFGRIPDVEPFPARSMREGPPPKGRSGMMIDLPGTQAVNRSIAPNISAVWKEWVAPDGATYFFHEPTQTLQRLRPGETEYETMIEGIADVPEEELQQRSHHADDPTVNMNTYTLRNLQAYGNVTTGTGINSVRSADLYRAQVLPASPRGAYSPTRQAPVEALAAPRLANQQYQGKRLHRLTLQPGDEPGQAVVSHQVQSLDAGSLTWDRATGAVFNKDPEKQGTVGAATLFRQWEHVRKILNQGRYFKKHALRSDQEAFRFVFLTGDNSYVCCVPTSQVMLNVHKDPMTFGNATDTIQYYGPDTRAMAVNSITHVVLGTQEPMVYRRSKLDAESTFVIVGRTHALILECNTPDEAKFFCDAWNFFLYYSKPTNSKATRTPQMAAPVTLGTRTGLAF